MDVTGTTDKGAVITIGRKEYREIGLDLEGNERLGAWQIKEIIDLSLQPRKKTEERFTTEFPEDTKSVDVEVTLKYYLSPSYEARVHRIKRTVYFGR